MRDRTESHRAAREKNSVAMQENYKNYKENSRMKELKVRLTFLEEILGTASADPEIHETFIASNAPDAPVC